MQNPMLNLSKRDRRRHYERVRGTMRAQRALLDELGRQGMSVGQSAWFFNFVTQKYWKETA